MKNSNNSILIIIMVAVIVSSLTIIMMNKDKNNKKPVEEEEVVEKFYLSQRFYNTGDYIDTDKDGVKALDKDSYIIYTFNNFCIFTTPCDEIFKVVMDKYKIDIVSVPFSELKETKYYDTVKLAPSVLLIKDGEIISYLKADSDEDFKRYQDPDEFEKWLDKYIYLEKEANE